MWNSTASLVNFEQKRCQTLNWGFAQIFMSASEKYTQDALDKYTWSYFRNTAWGEQLWVFVTESTAPFQILENQKRSLEFSFLLVSLCPAQLGGGGGIAHYSASLQVPISGLGSDRDQCPRKVPKKARFASQVPKLTNVILNCVLIHWYV